MQSSRLLDGVQWNMPVLSYFISVFSKSKSDLSGAMTAWPFLIMESILIGALNRKEDCHLKIRVPSSLRLSLQDHSTVISEGVS